MKGFIQKLASKLTPSTGKKASAKSSETPLNAMLGKQVVFQGKFLRGERDRLVAMTESQQGIVSDALAAATDFLVLADITAGKTVQKQAASLNAKGARIQVLDRDAFRKLIEPTKDQILSLIRGGKQNAELLLKAFGSQRAYHYLVLPGGPQPVTPLTFVAEKFDGSDFSGYKFHLIHFENCSFVETNLSSVILSATTNCDFTRANLAGAVFTDASGSRFLRAGGEKTRFSGPIEGADFSKATLNKALFSQSRRTVNAGPGRPVQFGGASLDSAAFHAVSLGMSDFSKADLASAIFRNCYLAKANFHSAVLRNAAMAACNLTGADFTHAVLNNVDFSDSDMTEAKFDGADLGGANFFGATLDRIDFSKAKNYSPQPAQMAVAGPALTELDAVAQQARRIQIRFQIQRGSEPKETVGIDTARLKYGWGITLPPRIPQLARRQPIGTVSGALEVLVNRVGKWKICYETVDVKSTKSPKTGKELRDIAMKAVAEAFSQPIPPADELAAAVNAYRAQLPGHQPADAQAREEAKKRREEYKRQQEQLKKNELKKIEKTIQKQVGKVADIATFLKALEIRADKAKIDKATKMLKADRFKLFNDVTETHLNGVVKSQTDSDLVYACRIEASGAYACCTQNLNICGGLRGSICKHLLVLIIGLVQAGELDPSVIDSWIAKTHSAKPELNKETMGEIFIRYKGAEAGEVDWRPTQTVPEDYYAL